MPIAGEKRKIDYRLQLHGYRGGIKIGNVLVGYIHCGGNPSFLRALRLPQWIYPRWCHYYHHHHHICIGNDAKIMNQKFYPIKTLYFYMERRKVSLNTTIKRAAKLWGKRCPKKVLNTCGPACATSLLFSTFFWLFQGLFLTASPVPVKMVVVVHNSANSLLGIMNRVRGRWLMVCGFFSQKNPRKNPRDVA